jgi:pyruvate dehydrogenase E2 component (dihydrolipoamide acetyltransferase)
MREFTLPDVGEGVTEGELLEWHVEPDDRVAEDQVVAEVETDKAVVDVPAPVDGTVRELRAEPGDVVPVGDVIVTFDVDGEETTESAQSGAADSDQSGGRVFAPPSARQLARELGVDIERVEGSGPGGRVAEADVRAAADGQDGTDGEAGEEDHGDTGLKAAVTRIDDGDDGAGEDEADGLTSVVSRVDDAEDAATETANGPKPADRERTLAAPATRRVAEDLDVDLDSVPTDETRDGEPFVTEAAVREYAETQQQAKTADVAALAGDETDDGAAAVDSDLADTQSVAAGEGRRREPYRGVRKTIGEAMERSKFTAPHATHHDTVDVSALVETRDRLEPRAEKQGVKLTYLPFVMKAVVAALQEHPVLNTTFDEDEEEIVYRSDYHIGVATATDAGLMVPVVERVDEKGLLAVAADVTELTEKARDRSVDVEELRGSTFSVTNFGAIGGEYATPIINYPETAILGLGAIEQRPTVVDGEVVARHTLPLSLSIDHRVVDGADAARFVNTVAEYLEDPTLLLL